MSQWRKWALDRLIITAITVVVLWGGTWIALNTTWFKAPRRGTPVGEMTEEETRRHPASQAATLSAGSVHPPGWGLVEASCSFDTRETIAVVDLEIRAGDGRVIARESATTFADGGRTLISFPVLTQAQRISISGRFAMEGPADATVEFRMRYFKLGRSPKLLRRTDGEWSEGGRLAEDGRRRDPETGLYAHALSAAEFRALHTELPFEAKYAVPVHGNPPDDLSAARQRAGVPDGPAIWLRGEEAWLLEGPDDRTHLVGASRTELLPGRLVALVTKLRDRETAPRAARNAGTIRIGLLSITVENLLETVRRLDGDGGEIRGLTIHRR